MGYPESETTVVLSSSIETHCKGWEDEVGIVEFTDRLYSIGDTKKRRNFIILINSILKKKENS